MNSLLTQCRVCGNSFPSDTGFYSGTSKCKECYKAHVRANRAKNIDHYRLYDRTRYEADPARKEQARRTFRKAIETGKHTEYARSWRQKNPEKYKAQTTLNNAIRDGKIKRQPCIVCGGKAHAHHEDYSRPLDVIWLCPEHHSKHHVENRNYE